MRADFTRKIKSVCVCRGKNVQFLVFIFALTLTILAGAENIEDGSGDGEFADAQTHPTIKLDPSNLKMMSRHEIEMLENRRRKSNSRKPKLGKVEESSGFREVTEANDGDHVQVADDDDDDDEDNERENPPFPPRSDAFWKEEQKTKGLNPDDKLKPSAEPDVKAIDPRPNIILILTDDQDIELGSMEYMPETLKVFREGGAEFRHGYVTTPMCCPSRSSMLTGLYVHNHQVYTNNDNCSSVLWRERFEKKTFASYMWAEGYYTSYIGKYLNKYDGSHIPHGWDEWNTLLMNSRFYNYTLNRNGKKVRYGNKYDKDYYPDSIANDTIDFLNRMAFSPGDPEEEGTINPSTSGPGQGQNQDPSAAPIPKKRPSQPFLLVVSFPSPHGPEDSAPQYSQMFLNDTPHHTPSYNYAPNLDKQWILRTTSRMTPVLKDFTNLLMTKRLQTLQSVDVAVKNIFDALRRQQLLDNTYVFYTSDHGYHVGQFGLIKGKSMPYEFDIRVPFFLTTPKNFVRGRTVITEPVLNIDLAPTFLDLAGIAVPGDMDGRSMVPLLKKYSNVQGSDPDSGSESGAFEWTGMFLIESSGRRDIGPDGGSLNSTNRNNVASFARERPSIHKNRSADEVLIDNETFEMTNLCLLHPHPCQPGQKKYCRREKARIRFKKCRANSDFLTLDEEMSDGTISTPGANSTSQRCTCRPRRSADDDDTSEFDWDSERHKIDVEIEALKLRIESLRERRREMRRRWTSKAYSAKLDKTRVVTPDTNKKNQIEVKIIHPTMVRESPSTSTEISTSTTTTEQMQSTTPSTTTAAPEASTIDREYRQGRTHINNPEPESPRRNNGNGNSRRTRPRVNHDSDEDEDRLENLEDELTKLETARPNQGKGQGRSGLILEENKTVKPSGVFSNDDDVSLEEMIEEEEQQLQRQSGRGRKGKNRAKSDRNNKNNGRNEVRNRGEEDTDSDDDNNGSENNCDCNNNPKSHNQREREERKRKKLMSKLRKKQRFLNRIDDPKERQEAETCGTEDKMNCFWHDKDHWRTAPLWTSESFCFCMNSNNNTYSCLRAINATHNYLYCQFITGFKMYFDLKQDPYELRNLIGNLASHDEAWIASQLQRLKSCQGREECGSQNARLAIKQDMLPPSIWEKIFGRWRRKKKNRNGNKRFESD